MNKADQLNEERGIWFFIYFFIVLLVFGVTADLIHDYCRVEPLYAVVNCGNGVFANWFVFLYTSGPLGILWSIVPSLILVYLLDIAVRWTIRKES